jgi:hypothetical protein
MRLGIVPGLKRRKAELLACRKSGKHIKCEASRRKNKENSSESKLKFHDRQKTGHVEHATKVMI